VYELEYSTFNPFISRPFPNPFLSRLLCCIAKNSPGFARWVATTTAAIHTCRWSMRLVASASGRVHGRWRACANPVPGTAAMYAASWNAHNANEGAFAKNRALPADVFVATGYIVDLFIACSVFYLPSCTTFMHRLPSFAPSYLPSHSPSFIPPTFVWSFHPFLSIMRAFHPSCQFLTPSYFYPFDHLSALM
jgi:hypothetical protein